MNVKERLEELGVSGDALNEVMEEIEKGKGSKKGDVWKWEYRGLEYNELMVKKYNKSVIGLIYWLEKESKESGEWKGSIEEIGNKGLDEGYIISKMLGEKVSGYYRRELIDEGLKVVK